MRPELDTLVVAAAAALAAACTPTRPAASAGASALAITNVAVVDVAAGRVDTGRTVLVVGDRVTVVGPSGAVRVPAGATTVDARGRYLIPGLWDMHVHLGHTGRASLPLFVAHGVTAVRDMGGRFDEVRAWRDDVRTGALVGPRVLIAGPIVESARWLDGLRRIVAQEPGYDTTRIAGRIGVTTPDEARRAVATIAALGADFVKVRNAPPRDAYLALLDEARRRGLPVVGHPALAVPLAEAARAGHASVEHGLLAVRDGRLVAGVDAVLGDDRAATLRTLAELGVALTPTLVTTRGYRLTPDSVVLAVAADSTGDVDPRTRYLSRTLAHDWRQQIALKRHEGPLDHAAMYRAWAADLPVLRDAGVPILAGTDAGATLVFPGSGLHDELELLVADGGLSPLDALRAATLHPARFAGDSAPAAIAAGARADLVLLDASPLDDIEAVRRVRAVVLAGRLLDRPRLDALLAEVERAVRR